jgi:hypothetical protein
MFFLLPQRFFERIRIRLIDFLGNVFANPRTSFVEFERCIFLRHLLHAYQDFQNNGSSPVAPAGPRETCQYK